jgi:flagellar motor switch protein FliN
MAVEHVVAPDIEELSGGTGMPGARLGLSDLHRISLAVTAELGRVDMRVRDILALKIGSLVVLDKYAGQMTDVLVNDLPMARGEVVVIGDSLHVRISEAAPGQNQPAGEHRA